MKKTILSSLLLGAALTAPLSATEYFFNDFDYRAVDTSFADWTSLNLELGKFAAGFTPTVENLDLWASNWVPFADPAYSSSGYFAAGPEWSASLALPDNTDYAVGDSLYLWAFNALTGPGREWALLADANWKVVLNDPLDPNSVDFGFSGQTTALFGVINANREFVQTVAAVPVPEPATWVGMTAGSLMMGFIALRRRKARAV